MAIVPALNEEKNIARVLRALLESKKLQEVMVVVDATSKDKTAKIAHEMGAKVIISQEKGKGNAMREGVRNTQADIIFFADADLIGFSTEHIAEILASVLRGEAQMAVGVRERKGWGKIAQLLIKLDPLFAVGGERALKRSIFEAVPKDFLKGFMVEVALNYYCRVNRLPVTYVKLKGVSITIKEKKWGFLRGFYLRLKMIGELIKIRLLVLIKKNEFKNV